ncbi:GNAT family N-acetyltransferase [Bacillus sp. CGMCC 1.16541]|uniref:GNAT family N-acetyltransferase n=1 Tax=Bacillus sp. CGMCC 1.16541 TaxID=2185143 RepID=UPI0013A59300|nr:GNAT family N-acetyltransferase [Bacillus sp. CGMCC 1.16541]
MHIQIDLLTQLTYEDIHLLLQESLEEGYAFVDRLTNEYFSGINRFTNRGEALFGVYNEEEQLIAIGDINRDSYSKEPQVGRMRRFYVKKSVRRKGIGTELAETILDYAQYYFSTIVIHTDSDEAASFYQSLGFVQTSYYEKSSHAFHFA